MNTLIKSGSSWLFAALMTLGLAATTQAQVTANWIGPASGGEWNTGANWDTGFPPLDATTNALIGPGTNVSYNFPMAASSFGALTNNGALYVNTNGFNCSAIIMTLPSVSKILLMTNSGAAVTVTGNLTMGTNCSATLVPGASLTVGSLIVAASESSSANNTCTFTNRGGTLTANSTTINNNTGTGTGLMVISGGVNNLGNTAVGRYHGTSASTPGTEGLAISGGVVTMTNLNLGNNGVGASFLTGFISGGTVTNFGSVFLNNITAGRYSRLLQTGGLFVVPDPGVINPNSTTAGSVTSIYSVTGGTNIVGGLYFGNSNTLVAATAYFTNAAVIYVGSQGIGANGTSINTISLNNGGMFGASADWVGNLDMLLNGGSFTFQAAGNEATPHNITLNGVLRGSGGLVQTGGGTLTLNASNIYSGLTFVKNGTLALGTNALAGTAGSIAGAFIIVGSGATFDVSQVAPYSINPLQTLGGSSVVTGAVTVASTGIINPGSNQLSGTLTFTNDLIEPGGVVNHFDVPGDTINVGGSFTVSGTNTIEIAGSLPSGTAYALAHYGSFNGDLTNFVLTGATGVLSNSVSDKTLYVVVSASLRGNTNLTWIGNSVINDWDTHNTTNWLNAGTGSLDFFLAGDTVRFDNTGGLNPVVNIPGAVSPASVIVDSTSNYVFSGVGSINGPNAGLTKTNSGTLTILTTNNYAGVTTFGGGALEVLSVANSTVPSPLGASAPDPAFLVFNGGTLRYSGASASSDHGATLNAAAILDVTNADTTLTISGNLTGIGGLAKVGNGVLSLTGVNTYSGITTISNGTLIANGSTTIGAAPLNLTGGTLSLASASAQQFYANIMNVVSTNTLIVNGANANNIIGNSSGNGGFTNSGFLNLSIPNASGLCTINAGFTTNFTGTIRLTDDTTGTLRFNSGGNATSAQQCTGSATTTFDLGNGSGSLANRNGGGASFGNYDLGALFGGPTTFLRGSLSSGTSSTYFIGAKNLDSMFAGTIVNATGPTVIVKVGSGALTLEGQNTFTGSTIISNGVLALAFNPTNFADGAIISSTNIFINSGAILDVSGRSDDTMPLNFGQVISGNGTLKGTLDASAGGTVSGGDGISGNTGTLTVTNQITLGAGTAWMKLNRASAPNSDKLIAPTFNLNGGTLIVTNAGTALHVGDTFTLFNGTLSGTLGNVFLPNYYTWDTSQLAANGTITVTAVSLPTLKADFSTLSSGSITLSGANGVAGTTFSVLSSTNLSLPAANWSVVATGSFDNTGAYSVPVTVDPTVPTEFFILSAQ